MEAQRMVRLVLQAIFRMPWLWTRSLRSRRPDAMRNTDMQLSNVPVATMVLSGDTSMVRTQPLLFRSRSSIPVARFQT